MKDKFQSKAVPRGTRTIWRYLSALILLFSLSIGQMWGEVVGKNTSTTGTIIYSNINSTGSNVNLTAGTEENGFNAISGASFKSGPGVISVAADGYFALCVDDITEGTVYHTMTVTSNVPDWTSTSGGSDGRYAQLYIGDTGAKKYLYTKYSTNTTVEEATGLTKEGSKVRGIYSFSFTSSDLTTIGTKKYLKFKALGGEYKPAGFKIVASTTPAVDTQAPTLSGSVPANSATDVAVEGTIVLTFSEAIATVDGSKFTLDGATKGTVAIDGTDAKKVNVPYSGAANSATVTLSVAAEAVADAAGNKSAALSAISFTTVAAVTPACPSGLAISGTAAYTEGQTISLTAALSEGNGEITYTWYKGADLATAKAAGSIGTGTSFSKASCTTGDAGNYFCVASKDACSDAESTAYAVTVEEKTCPTSGVVYSLAIKSGASTRSLNANTAYDLTSSDVDIIGGTTATIKNSDPSNNGKMSIASGPKFSFGGNNAYLKIVLDCPLQAGDKVDIIGGSGKQLSITPTEPSPAPKDASPKVTTASYTYTVVADDALDGKSTFYMGRAEASGTTMTGITITRPYNVTFVSAHGTAPTTPTKAVSFTLTELSDASFTHTGWTADKAVKVGGETKAASTALAVDATVELTDNTTFTATWEAKAPTFAVTYKANNGTSEADINDPAASTFAANTFTAPEGKIFNGWNTSATGDGTPYAVGAAVTAVTTVYAQWVVDPTIRLIKSDGTLNTVDFASVGGTLKDDKAYTVDSREFAKYVVLSGTYTSAIAGNTMQTKYIIYDTQSDKTDIKLYLYNTNSSAQNLYYQVFKDGAAVGSKQEVSVASKGDGQVVVIPTIEHSKKTRVVFCVQSTNILFCQIEVLENGTALASFGENGYQLSIPGRPASTSKLTNIDGFEIKSYNDLKMGSGTNYLALRALDGSTYVKFTVASTIQLQVTTANANKFYVCAANIGDADNDKQYGGEAGTHNVNLLAGTYYIVPTAGSSSGEVQITKLAFATAPAIVTVTFKDGASTLGTQDLFSGDKATALDPAPTKSGYRFVEWQLIGSAYDFDAAVTTNIELDASWQETVTVTFNPANGESTFTRTPDKGAAIAAGDIPANPEWPGHVFQGWTLDATAEPVVYVNLATQTFSAAVTTLIAVWELAQTDATISALSYNSNAIDVSSAVDVSGVQTYTVHLPWGSTVNSSLISYTPTAGTASAGAITYDSGDLKATFTVTAGDGTTTIDYAIQFVIDAKRGTSIIKAVTANNTVTGLIGGTRSTNLSNGASKKLDKQTYFGMTLANDETFQEGDVFIVNITAPADLGKFMIYADAERTELIADQGIVYTKPDVAEPVICPTGEMMMTLPAAANGKKSLYLSRENGNTQWNVTFSYIEVTREMDPAIKSFKIGDVVGVIDESVSPKTITLEVPYGTDRSDLTAPVVEAYGNNGATFTPASQTDFSSVVDYTVTDGYSEFSTTYKVTVNVADPSENANLASLEVAGYSLDFDPAVTSYNVLLDYGTTTLPTITYTVEDATATAAKVEGSVSGATTITVTPQAGASYEKVYTINFSVSTSPKYVIYDGSTMTNIASATGSDATTGFSYSLASNVTLSGSEVAGSWNAKNYTHAIKGFKPNDNANNIVSFVIPEEYVAKVRLVGSTNSSGSERSMFISTVASRNTSDAIAGTIITSNSYDAVGVVTNLLLPGTYYVGSTDSYRLFELSIQLYSIDYSRDVTEGRYGTICLPNGGLIVGATLYEVAYYGATSEKIFFDEILGGVMEAGVPYVFLPEAGASKLAVVYTDEMNASAKSVNGLVGSYTEKVLPTDGSCYVLYNNQYLRVVNNGATVKVGANRAYIKLDDIGRTEPALAPGRRRISMGVTGEQTATALDNLNANEKPMKVMIDGQLFIIRGEQMFDATGRLVK